jgi:hypothetical protein
MLCHLTISRQAKSSRNMRTRRIVDLLCEEANALDFTPRPRSVDKC